MSSSRFGQSQVRRIQHWRLLVPGLTVVVLVLSALMGFYASPIILLLLLAAAGAVILLWKPFLGLFALLAASLAVPVEFNTGTAVALNPATIVLPALLAVWGLDMARRRDFSLVNSAANRPLLLFVVSGLISLLIGSAMWDPAVPRPGSFLIVQLAQWMLFLLSAGAFLLTGNLVANESNLKRLVFWFLLVGGFTAALFLSFRERLLSVFTALQIPFWILFAALSAGQLLYNRHLTNSVRLLLISAVGMVLVYVLVTRRSSVSGWVGVITAIAVLFWLRWPRLRWPVILVLVFLNLSGLLSSTLYDFAGGDAEWQGSGGSRLVLIGRVIQVTLRNPITGLGPAAYRLYSQMEPLVYGQAVWLVPNVSSHNNYVDLFSHSGLIGLGSFLWFAFEVIKMGFALRKRFPGGFLGGFVNSMLAVWTGSLVVMLLADWILPFVYNIGFRGFQSSVLIWFFLGGLVTVENLEQARSPGEMHNAA